MKFRMSTTKLSQFMEQLSSAELDLFMDSLAEWTRKQIQRLQRKDDDKSSITLEVSELPAKILDILINRGFVEGKTASRMRLYLAGNDIIKMLEGTFNSIVKVKDILDAYASLTRNADFNTEVRIGSRWYPAKIAVTDQTYSDMKWIQISAKIEVWEMAFCPASLILFQSDFEDEQGVKKQVNLLERLAKEGIQLYNAERWEDEELSYIEIVAEALKTGSKPGLQLSVCGEAIKKYNYAWWEAIEVIELGSKTESEIVIVEPELEDKSNKDRWDRYDRTGGVSPFVRVFSLRFKEYLYIDIRNTSPYVPDSKAVERLVLPKELHDIIRIVFTQQVTMGDIVRGKHGGMIVMAAGNSGVGKTLTAEAYAESTGRPLYMMEVAELGSKLSDIELNLARIFLRVKRWNAVLLFDEADVFLRERNEDLERSAIVGIFLRVMDYYQGLMFMTTNRPEVIDRAFKSRITLLLKYPDLNKESRKKIWEVMLEKAEIKVNHGSNLDRVAELKLNGRQIRNMVRLASMVFPNKEISADQLIEVCKYACPME